MPRYSRNNYELTIDSSFSPFTLQEMMTPMMMYKDAYEKSEAAYEDLTDKADKFKYLSETLPEGSKARQLYEGYATELSKQATDLATNGLSMNNRRALTNLKRRYQGEIGRLATADAAMEEERKLRRTMNAKDSSMLYAQDNLSIDDFLDGSTPNLYNISGTELYTRGAAAGKSASSRVYSAGDEGSTLGGYYKKWVERNGYSKESMDAFRANASAIPELQQAVDDILAERGVLENLSGSNLERARQSVLNGIIDGSIYQESVKPIRDPGVMSESERRADGRAAAANRRAQEQWDIQKDIMYQKNPETGKWELNPTYASDNYEVDPTTGKIKKKTSASTPEEKAMQEMQKKEALERMQNAQKVKNARTVEEASKAGYVPVLTTVHPSHGSSKGLSVEEARKQQKYENIEGWRSGRQGTDVPDLYIDWTNAPLIEGSQSPVMDLFQWSSGSSTKPNNGDFSYNIKGAQTKMLSDQEYNNLPESVRISIEEGLRAQGYEDNTPFEVMQVTGRGGKTSYMTLVPKDKEILLGD